MTHPDDGPQHARADDDANNFDHSGNRSGVYGGNDLDGGDDYVAPAAGSAPEPVAIAQAISALLLAGVTAGWFVLDSPIISTLLTIVGIAGTVAATLKARGSVDAHR